MENYAFIYDIIAAAFIIGMLFAGLKKGFASAVVSAVAVAAAFICAMTFSEPVTRSLYQSLVEEKLEQAVDKQLGDAMEEISLGGIESLDYGAVLISGTPARDITPDYGGTGKAVIDLSSLDLSGTGIAQADLSRFGVSQDADFSDVSAKTAEFTHADIEKYGLGMMAVAQYLAVSAQGSDFLAPFTQFASQVGEALPIIFGSTATAISSGSADALRSVVLIMLDTSASARDAVIDGIIEPCFIMIMRNIAFVVIFALVCTVLGIAASLLKFVNKIPVLGGFNSAAGAVLGAVEGAVAVFVACLFIRMLITLTGGNVVFLNEATIDETYLFRLFYHLDFLNFVK